MIHTKKSKHHNQQQSWPDTLLKWGQIACFAALVGISGCSSSSAGGDSGTTTPTNPTRESLIQFQSNLPDTVIYRNRPVAAAPNESGELVIESDPLATNYSVRLQYLDISSSPPVFRPIANQQYALEYSETTRQESIFHGYDAEDRFVPVYIQGLSSEIQPLLNQLFSQNFGSSSFSLLEKTAITPQAGTQQLTFSLPEKRNAPNFDATLLYEETDILLSDYQEQITDETATERSLEQLAIRLAESAIDVKSVFLRFNELNQPSADEPDGQVTAYNLLIEDQSTNTLALIKAFIQDKLHSIWNNNASSVFVIERQEATHTLQKNKILYELFESNPNLTSPNLTLTNPSGHRLDWTTVTFADFFNIYRQVRTPQGVEINDVIRDVQPPHTIPQSALRDGFTYFYQVAAQNKSNLGPKSNTQSLSFTVIEDQSPIVQFDELTDATTEISRIIKVDLTLNRDPTQNSTLTFRTTGTAAEQSDYIFVDAVGTPLSRKEIPIFEFQKTTSLYIQILTDLTDESVETLIITLDEAAGLVIGQNNQFTLSIAELPNVIINNPPTDILTTRNITLNFSLSDDDIPVNLETLLIANGESPGPFTTIPGTTQTITGLEDGQYTYQVRAFDNGGIRGIISETTFTVDATAPTLFIQGPETPTRDKSATFILSSNEEVTFEGKVNNLTDFLPITSPWTVSVQEGEIFENRLNTVAIRATDRAGNQTVETESWTIDTDPPVLNILSRPITPTQDQTIEIAFSSEASATVEASLNNGPFETVTTPFQTNETIEGDNTVRFRATDSLGNMSPIQTIEWELISVGPAITVLVQPPADTRQRTVTFDIQTEVPNTTIQSILQKNNQSLAAQPTITDLSATQKRVQFFNLEDGEYDVLLTAFNSAQFSGPPKSLSWTVDTQAPTIAFLNPENNPAELSVDRIARFELDAEAGLKFEFGFATKNRQANLYNDIDFVINRARLIQYLHGEDGDYIFKARGIDPAGNIGPFISHEWTIDTLEPTIQFVTVPPVRSGISTQPFSVASNKPVTFLYKLQTDPVFNESQNSSILLENLENRTYTLSVKARDSANRESETITTQFIISSLGPRTFITEEPDAITRLTQLGFTYESSTDTTFQYKLIGESTGTIHPFTPTTSRQVTLNVVSDDLYTFFVKAFDSEGNEGPLSQTQLLVDSIAPTLSLSTPILSFERDVTFLFDVTDNADVEIRATLNQTIALTGSGSGTSGHPISIDADTLLDEGNHTITAIAIDQAGNISDPFTYTWETAFIPPNASFLFTPPSLTNDPQPTFKLGANEGALIAISLDSDAPSDFRFTTPIPGVLYTYASFAEDLADGEHTLYIKAKYPNRPFGPITSYTWRIQTTLPSIALQNPPAQPSNEENPLITLVSDTGVHFEYSLKSDDVSHSLDSLTDSDFLRIPLKGNAIILPSLESGKTYTLYARTIDEINTTSNVLSYSWEADLESPAIRFSEKPLRLEGQNAAQFIIDQTNGSDATSLLFKLDNRGNYQSQDSLTINLAGLSDGLHTLWVKAVDAAGNISEILTYDWEVDLREPILSFSTQPNRYSRDGSPSFVITTNTLIDSFSYSLQSPNDPSAITDSDGIFTLALAEEGDYTIYINAFKGLTRSETLSTTWTYDRTPPILIMTGTPNATLKETEATLAFNFANPNEVATVSARINGQLYSPITSPFIITPILEGSNTLSISARDTAGNQSPTQTIHYTGDRTAPTTTILNPDTSPARLTNKTTAVFELQSSETSATISYYLENDTTRITNPSPIIHEHGDARITVTYNALPASNTPYTFVAVSEDTLGNIESPGIRYTWLIDENAIDMQFNERLSILPSRTTQTQQPFSLSTDANQLTYVLDDGNVTPISQTTFSVPETGTLADGSHTITITGLDSLGNQNTLTHTWIVDTTAPNTLITSGPSPVTRDRTATFTYTATETPITFLGRLDGGDYNVLPDNTITFTQLSEGNHTFEIKSIDGAGNEDTTPVSYTWRVDRSNPSVEIINGPPSETRSLSGSINFISSDETAQFFIKFTYENTASTQFFEITNDVSLIDNTFTYFLPNNQLIANEEHTVTIKAIDAAGNESDQVDTYTWTIDTLAPTPIYEQSTPTEFNENRASFILSTDPLESASFQFKIYEHGDTNKGNLPFIDTPAQFTISALDDGLYQIDYRAIDEAGNTSNIRSSRVFEIDTTGPELSTISIPRLSNQNSLTLDLSVTPAEPDVTFQYRLNQGAFQTLDASTLTLTNIVQGNQVLDLRAIDSASNIGPIQTLLWDVDLGLPALTQLIFVPENTQSIQNGQLFTRDSAGTIRLTGNEDAHHYFGSLDISDLAPLSSYTALQEEREVTLTGLTEGQHSFSAYTQDEAGNNSVVQTVEWIVDQTPPTFTRVAPSTISSNQLIVQLNHDDTFPVTFQARPNDGQSVFEEVSNPAIFNNLSEGQHGFVFRAIDHLGNTSGPQLQTVLVDTTAPSLVKIGDTLISNQAHLDVTFSTNEAIPFDFSVDDEDQNAFISSTQLIASALGNDPDRPGFLMTRYRLSTEQLGYTPGTDQQITLRIRSGDVLGNQSTTQRFDARIDQVMPNTLVLSTPPSDTAQTSISTVVGSNESDVTTYNITLKQDNNPFTHTIVTEDSLMSDSAQEISLSQLPENHLYTLEVSAIDPAGNIDPSPSIITVSIDTVPPTLDIVSGPVDQSTITERQPSLTLEFSTDVKEIDYTLNGQTETVAATSLSNGIFQVPQQLANGDYEIVFVAKDYASNGSNQERRRWSVNATVPQLVFSPELTLNPHGRSFTFNVSSNRDIAEISYTVESEDNLLVNTTDTPGVASPHYPITVTVDNDNLPSQQPMTLTVTVTDSLDRVSSPLIYTWETNYTAPTHTIVSTLPETAIPPQTLPVRISTSKEGSLFHLLRTTEVDPDHLPLRTGWTEVPLAQAPQDTTLSIPLDDHDTDYFLYIKTTDLNNQDDTPTQVNLSTTAAFIPYQASFTEATLSTPEDENDVTIPLVIALNRPAESPIQLPVRFDFRESTADKTRDASFVEQQNILTFTFDTGDTESTQEVVIHDDEDQENNETLQFVIDDLQNDALFNNGDISRAIITIFDNDTPSLVKFSSEIDAIDFPEDGSFFDFQIQRSVVHGNEAKPFTVTLNSTLSTAILDGDFHITRQSTGERLQAETPFTFSSDQLTSFIIRILPINDFQFEPNKTISLALETESNQPIRLIPVHTMTLNLINDDDPLPSLESVSLQNSINGIYLTWDLDQTIQFDHYDIWRSTQAITTDNPGERVATNIPSNQSHHFDDAIEDDPSTIFLDNQLYFYNVRRVDSAGNQSSTQVDAFINYINHPPEIQTNAIHALTDGTPLTDQIAASQLINTIQVTDANTHPVSQANEAVLVTLLNADDLEAFTLDSDSGRLFLTDPSMINAVDSPAVAINNASHTYIHSLRIRATDTHQRSTEKTVYVHFTSINDAPVFTANHSLSVPENSAVGSQLGDIGVIDPDEAFDFESVQFEILSGNDDGHFSITAENNRGQLILESALDFESVTSYTLRIRATDAEGAQAEGDITVVVTNINEPPTLYQSSTAINENTADTITFRFGNRIPIDPDSGNVLSYDPEGDAYTIRAITIQDNAFQINNNQLLVRDPAALNYETNESHSLLVEVEFEYTQDDVVQQHRETFTVNFQDIQEAPVFNDRSYIIDSSSYGPGVIIGQLTGTDPEDDAITYTLTNSSDYFEIHSRRPEIVFQDLSSNPPGLIPEGDYTLEITAASNGLSDDAIITLVVVHTETITAEFNIQEGTESGTILGTVPFPAGFDVDDITQFDGNTDNFFSINANGQLVLNSDLLIIPQPGGASISLSIDPSAVYVGNTYLLQLTLDNGQVRRLTMAINVIPTPTDNSPTVSDQHITFNDVSQVLVLGDDIADSLDDTLSFTVEDPQDRTVTLALNSLNADDIFELTQNGYNGALGIRNYNLLNDESYSFIQKISNESYIANLEIGVTNSDGLASTGKVTLVLTSPLTAPSLTQGGSATIQETASIGTVVSTITAIEPNLTQRDELTFAITGTYASGPFAINAQTGQLTTLSTLDFESQSTYDLTIEVTDPTGLSASTQYTITVTDSPEAPIMQDQSLTVAQNTPAETLIGYIQAQSIGADEIVFSFQSLTNDFSIDSQTGLLTAAQTITLSKGNHTYGIQAFATDLNGPSTTAELTIVVTDDTPPEEPADIQVPPQSLDTSLTIDEDTIHTFDVGDFPYSDANSDPLERIRFTSIAPQGSLKLDDSPVVDNQEITVRQIILNQLTYHPAQDESGTPYSTATFQVNDGTDWSTNSDLTINVSPISDPVTISPMSPLTISAIAPNGTLIATATGISNPENQTLNFSIIAGNTDAIFTITQLTGDITIIDNSLLNDGDTHTLTIQLSDETGLTTTTQLSITVQTPTVLTGELRTRSLPNRLQASHLPTTLDYDTIIEFETNNQEAVQKLRVNSVFGSFDSSKETLDADGFFTVSQTKQLQFNRDDTQFDEITLTLVTSKDDQETVDSYTFYLFSRNFLTAVSNMTADFIALPPETQTELDLYTPGDTVYYHLFAKANTLIDSLDMVQTIDTLVETATPTSARYLEESLFGLFDISALQVTAVDDNTQRVQATFDTDTPDRDLSTLQQAAFHNMPQYIGAYAYTLTPETVGDVQFSRQFTTDTTISLSQVDTLSGGTISNPEVVFFDIEEQGFFTNSNQHQLIFGPNLPPVSPITTTQLTVDVAVYTFLTSDFSYNDPEGAPLEAISILQLPNHGRILLNDIAISAGDRISAQDITDGNLKYESLLQEGQQENNNITNLTYRVWDPQQRSVSDAFLQITIDTNFVPPSDIVLSDTIVTDDEDTTVHLSIGTLSAIDDNDDETHTFSLVVGEDSDDFIIIGNVLHFRSGTILDNAVQDRAYVTVRAVDNRSLSMEKRLTIFIDGAGELAIRLNNPLPNSLTLTNTGIAFTGTLSSQFKSNKHNASLSAQVNGQGILVNQETGAFSSSFTLPPASEITLNTIEMTASLGDDTSQSNHGIYTLSPDLSQILSDNPSNELFAIVPIYRDTRIGAPQDLGDTGQIIHLDIIAQTQAPLQSTELTVQFDPNRYIHRENQAIIGTHTNQPETPRFNLNIQNASPFNNDVHTIQVSLNERNSYAQTSGEPYRLIRLAFEVIVPQGETALTQKHDTNFKVQHISSSDGSGTVFTQHPIVFDHRFAENGTRRETLQLSIGTNSPPESDPRDFIIQVSQSTILTPAHFGFSDNDGDNFTQLKVNTPPAEGQLTLDGAAVIAGQVIPESEIQANKLIYTAASTPPAGGTLPFTFQVHDGFDYSDETTLTLHIRTEAQLPSLDTADFIIAKDIGTSATIGNTVHSNFDPTTVAFSLSDSPYFTINAQTGVLQTKATFASTLQGGDYNIIITASDHLSSQSETITITVDPLAHHDANITQLAGTTITDTLLDITQTNDNRFILLTTKDSSSTLYFANTLGVFGDTTQALAGIANQLTVRRNGNPIVTFPANNQAVEYDADTLSVVRNYSITDPRGVAAHDNTMLFVASGSGDSIKIFNELGSQIREITGVSNPNQIVFDKAGLLYVAESGQTTLKIFKNTPNTHDWAQSGTLSLNGVATIADFTIRPDNTLWVSDSTNNQYKQFDLSGTLLTTFGYTQSGSGSHQFNAPTGIALNDDGKILTLDNGNNRLKRYGTDDSFASLTPPPAPRVVQANTFITEFSNVFSITNDFAWLDNYAITQLKDQVDQQQTLLGFKLYRKEVADQNFTKVHDSISAARNGQNDIRTSSIALDTVYQYYIAAQVREADGTIHESSPTQIIELIGNYLVGPYVTDPANPDHLINLNQTNTIQASDILNIASAQGADVEIAQNDNNQRVIAARAGYDPTTEYEIVITSKKSNDFLFRRRYYYKLNFNPISSAPTLSTPVFNQQTGHVDLSWTGTTDRDLYKFEIARRISGEDTFTTLASDLTTTTFSDTTTISGTSYDYRVRYIIGGIIDGPQSTVQSITRP